MAKKAVKKDTVKDPLTPKQRAKVQADAVKKHQESGEVLKNSSGEEFAPVPPEALEGAKKQGPKVAVLKKIMDVSECEEAIGKLKEFTKHDCGSHRELQMAKDSLATAIKSVETWLKNVDEVMKAIKKQEEKAEKIKSQKKA